MEHYTLPRLFVSDGTIEVMKWLALLSMTSDHVTKQPPAKAGGLSYGLEVRIRVDLTMRLMAAPS